METTCNGCGNTFTAQRSDARYCSPKCRTAAHRQRAKHRPAPVEPTPRRKSGPKVKHSDVLERLDSSLDGLTMAIDYIVELDQTVTKEQAAEARGNLTRQIKTLNRLKRMLSQRAQ